MPDRSQVVAVLGVIVIMLYTWTLLWFFWRVPSWLKFRTVGEIVTTLAYSLATNLVESLTILCGPLFLALVLPRKWFRDVFVARGTSLSMASLGYGMFVAYRFTDETTYPVAWLKLPVLLLIFAVIAGLVYLSGQFSAVRKVFQGVADRASIFVYILIPVSLLALLFIIVRLLIG